MKSPRVSVALITLCLAFFFALAACSNQNNSVTLAGATFTPIPITTTPEIAPTPQTGLVTVTGQLVDTVSRQPYTNTVVRLAKIIYLNPDDPNDLGTWMLDDANSPGDLTNDQGTFIIANVEAQNYVVVVGDFHTRYAIVTDTPDNALVVTTTADQIVDVETVDVVLP